MVTWTKPRQEKKYQRQQIARLTAITTLQVSLLIQEISYMTLNTLANSSKLRPTLTMLLWNYMKPWD